MSEEATSPTSSKSLRILVNLKHLGYLHNEKTHGSWAKGSSGTDNNLAEDARKRLAAELGTSQGGAGRGASPVQYASGGKGTGSSPAIKKELDKILQGEERIRPNARVTELRSEDLSPEQIKHVQKVLAESIEHWKSSSSVAHSAIKDLSGHTLEARYLPPDSSPFRVAVVRDANGAVTGIASYYSHRGNFVLSSLASNKAGGNRSGETAVFSIVRQVGENGTMHQANTVFSARPFYEKLGMREGRGEEHGGYTVGDEEMLFPQGAIKKFRAAVQNRISDERVTETVGKLKADATRWETQLLQKEGESTKEVRKLKSTPEQIKMLDEANALFEKYGGNVGPPSSSIFRKKVALAKNRYKQSGGIGAQPSYTDLLFSLKHLGNLHNNKSHGNWSKGPRKNLVGSVRRRLGEAIGGTAVQGGRRSPVKAVRAKRNDLYGVETRHSDNARITVIKPRDLTGAQRKEVARRLADEIEAGWRDRWSRPESDLRAARAMAKGAVRELTFRGKEPQIVVVLRNRNNDVTGVASFREAKGRHGKATNNWAVMLLGTDPSSSNRAGETIMFHIASAVEAKLTSRKAEGTVKLSPLPQAIPFYEKIGMKKERDYSETDAMEWAQSDRRTFIARVQARLDAENATPPNESTKEKGVTKMTPELEKYFAELDAIYEKHGCSVGSPSLAKKTTFATSSKSIRILVNLKHLGYLHNEKTHGSWAKGMRKNLVGAVRRRLGDDVEDASVQGGGGSPKGSQLPVQRSTVDEPHPSQMTRAQFRSQPLPVASSDEVILYHKITGTRESGRAGIDQENRVLESVLQRGLLLEEKNRAGETGQLELMWFSTEPTGYGQGRDLVGVRIRKDDKDLRLQGYGKNQAVVRRNIKPSEIVYVDRHWQNRDLGGRLSRYRNHKDSDIFHAFFIKEAIERGVQIPPKVLAEYWDGFKPGGVLFDYQHARPELSTSSKSLRMRLYWNNI